MLANAYGRFDPSGKTYVITDHRTPTPWCNVVSNGHYGFVVSQNGGGFSWLDNSQLNVLTRWEMDLIRDHHGRFVYIADLESGEVWSAAPAPCFPKYESYRCEHSPGSTTFATQHSQVRCVWSLAVAPGDPVEVWKVELTNTGDKPRRLRVSSFFEWCCGTAPDAKREFHRLFFTTRHDERRSAIIAHKNMWDVPTKTEKEHWNIPWPYVAAHAVVGRFDKPLATSDKAQFLGRYGQTSNPEMMTQEPGQGQADGRPFGRFLDASAALGGDLTIAAGQTVTLYYLLTIAPTEAEVLALIDRYRDERAAAAVLPASSKMWDDLLKPAHVETELHDFDLLNNYWLPYQSISGRLWARTGYYQQSGAFGFRDQLQDSQVWLPLDPARTRHQIMLHAAHQFADGSVYHWWHPLVEFGNHTACSDDYLWLPFLVANYIRETGDWSLLKAHAVFVDDAKGSTVLDHCRRSFERSFSRHSPRGLPLIGSCDWNDGLSAVGVDEKGESVWLAWFLVGLLGDWAHVLEKTGDAAVARDFASRREKLLEAINTHAWNGKYYRGATLDSGEWIGDEPCEAGKIFLNCQTWAILTDGGTEERLASAWRETSQTLLAEMGPLLLHPAYSEPRDDIGYITRYSPGSRENGGVYMHAATWALAAACKRRDTAAAQRIWNSVAPPRRGQNADAYRAEPYVTPGNVDGPLSDTPGKAGWTWYTGSAAWLNRVSLEWVLGIRPTWEGLMIDPCPMPSLGWVSAARTWRGRRIRVQFDAREFVAGVKPVLSIGGSTLPGNTLAAESLSESGETVVQVTWPRGGTGKPVVAASSKEVRS
jgi:cellobiose phosphorylase